MLTTLMKQLIPLAFPRAYEDVRGVWRLDCWANQQDELIIKRWNECQCVVCVRRHNPRSAIPTDLEILHHSFVKACIAEAEEKLASFPFAGRDVGREPEKMVWAEDVYFSQTVFNDPNHSKTKVWLIPSVGDSWSILHDRTDRTLYCDFERALTALQGLERGQRLDGDFAIFELGFKPKIEIAKPKISFDENLRTAHSLSKFIENFDGYIKTAANQNARLRLLCSCCPEAIEPKLNADIVRLGYL